MVLCVLQAKHCLFFVLDYILKDVHTVSNHGRQKLSSVYYCLRLKQRASVLTAHYKIFEILKSRVFSSNKIHYVNSAGPLCSVLCEVQLRIQAQMNADTLATAKALSNKLYFISDSASNQTVKSIFPPASMKL